MTSPTSIPDHTPEFNKNFIIVIRVIIFIIIIGVGAGVSYYLLTNVDEHERMPRKEREVIVNVETIKRKDKTVVISATGTVVPARAKLSLTSRVSGNIANINPNFEPGKIIAKGETILSLDKSDYKINLAKAKSALAKAESQKIQAESQLITAEYNYTVELGMQDIAKHEWKLLNNSKDSSELDKRLALRQPHLKSAIANVNSAKAAIKSATAEVAAREADLQQAELNLTRTEIKVPFSAVVVERRVNIGSEISTQTVVGELVEVDEFWIEALIPVDRLSWFRESSKSRLQAQVSTSGSMKDQVKWQGEIINIYPNIEENGRMAKVIIAVKKPLQGPTPLLLNSFVYVDIECKEQKNVFVIPRTAIHEGNRIWLVDQKKESHGEISNRLKIREVEIFWSDNDSCIVKDELEVGSLLITTNISLATPGLKLKIIDTPNDISREGK